MSKALISIGIVCIVIGVAWPWIQKLGLGQLPGDINMSGDKYSFHFPIVTCLVISVVLSGIAWLWNRFF